MGAPSIYKRIGLEISKRRKALRITQSELSGAVGISRAALANIERGEQRVFFDQIVGICAFLSVDKVDDLLQAPDRSDSDVIDYSRQLRVSGASLNRSQRNEVRSILEDLGRA